MEYNAITASSWHDVYEEMSHLLQQHYELHREAPGRKLLELLSSSELYVKHNGSWIKKALNRSGGAVDPIQFFVSFNRSKQTTRDRIVVINAALAVLAPNAAPWDKIDFTGCPTPVGFIIQKNRSDVDQSRIWNVFHQLAQKGEQALTSDIWTDAHTWEGIHTASFTIFLFWIRSDVFIPLDKNTKRLLESLEYIPARTTVNFDSYKSLLKSGTIEGLTYQQLATQAVSATTYNENAYPSNNDEFTTSINIRDTIFRVVGIKTLAPKPEVHKVLKPNTYYPIDQVILPDKTSDNNKDDSEIFYYTPTFSEELYHLSGFKVNLTAIVGKNGSGKSSLVDLLLMGVYNLSVDAKLLKNRRRLPNLQFELYWHSDSLYKIRFGTKITLYKFKSEVLESGVVKYTPSRTPLPIEQVDKYFFYSILINYSHYALNGSEMKTDWVTPLSHKNDGYQTPVVISPQRTKGNIDINREKELLNMRLLLNLLELHVPDYPQYSFRHLDGKKYIRFFSLSLNEEKNKKKKKELHKRINVNHNNVVKRLIKIVLTFYDIDYRLSSEFQFLADLNTYVVHKMWRIVENYLPNYKRIFFQTVDFLDQAGELDEDPLTTRGITMLNGLLTELQTSRNHYTIKFRQAINLFRHKELQNIVFNAVNNNASIDLDKYQEVVEDIRDNNLLADLTDLLPPAIFNFDFRLDDEKKSSLQLASSGEYQLVSVLSSILYHVRNISSNITDSKGYRNICILLDEIELYFHPNLQKHFVGRLLHALSQIDTNLDGIHIFFSTHSPFILSDLQQSKILKLERGSINSSIDKNNTFAANIHDLLADEFFLEEGSMGAFAQKHIEDAIQQLNYRRVENEIKKLDDFLVTNDERLTFRKNLEDELKFYEQLLERPLPWNPKDSPMTGIKLEKSFIRELINTIGEPLIRDNLRVMFQVAYPDLQTDNIKETIRDLMKQNNIKLQDLE